MPVEGVFEVAKQRLTSASLFYADAAASSSDPEVRHDNVYLIAMGEGNEAVAINDAILASVSSYLRDILLMHQTLPEPPEDR